MTPAASLAPREIAFRRISGVTDRDDERVAAEAAKAVLHFLAPSKSRSEDQLQTLRKASQAAMRAMAAPDIPGEALLIAVRHAVIQALEPVSGLGPSGLLTQAVIDAARSAVDVWLRSLAAAQA
jgi:hypothetical protein